MASPQDAAPGGNEVKSWIVFTTLETATTGHVSQLREMHGASTSTRALRGADS
eukprot:CAMPEP_0176096370 /NCGR_PEP_ID=MMETSP0120_2-20121206/48311_1 /TAXON_ID=160619 /ORGANISM="Kryptoperidinium foliaceum, Strain CCMP 1326" /LENGTH=52 /DNA_ID=CAMNT_0017430355 /DNA_START=1 /DNA_END=156 /DNA_ORIENTATION=-